MLTPDRTYTMNGVTIREKLIPDGATYRGTSKLYKAQRLLCGTGKPSSVTIHNTADLPGVYDDGEQYTRATWPNQNMGSSRVHFFIDDTGAWMNLRAGTGGQGGGILARRGREQRTGQPSEHQPGDHHE